MKLDIIRLGSLIKDGIGGPECGFLDVIYSFLLNKYSLTFYRCIFINQIDDPKAEKIIKQGKNIFINFFFLSPNDFINQSPEVKNQIRLDAINTALKLLAKSDSRFEVEQLVEIKNIIQDTKFDFEILYKRKDFTKAKGLYAEIILKPKIDEFVFFLDLYVEGLKKCRFCIYKGLTSSFYIDDLFYHLAWISNESLQINGLRSEITIIGHINDCKIEFRNNQVESKNAPVFELFKAHGTSQQKLTDYIYSLNPTIAAVLLQSLN